MPAAPPQHPVTTTKSPPPRPTKTASSKSSASAGKQPSAANLQHPGILTGYPGYPAPPHAGTAPSAGQRGGTAGQRPPNVTINPSLMQYNAMQQYNAYNAAMLNPALVST